MPNDKTRKLEYRVRFGEDGEILGESSQSALSDALQLKVKAGGESISEFLQRTKSLEKNLPGRLKPLVTRLLELHEEFALSGDFENNGGKRHLRISGQAIRNVDGDYTHTLLFLDDTAQTTLRRSYEYMFRLANHEIKSPLSVVLAAAEQAEEYVQANNQEGANSCLAMIDSNARAIEDMITRYLNLSRIESGAMPMHNVELVFSTDVLDPLVADMGISLTKRDMRVEFTYDEDEEEPTIIASRELLEIVMRNLISNAAKYGDKSTIINVIMARQEDDLLVTVENNGPTIPKEYLNKLFQRFMRLDAAQGAKGSGLGLYNARKLVEMWGGTIAVETGEQVTRFMFTLPKQGA
jgi:signal transduction histidine kinase